MNKIFLINYINNKNHFMGIFKIITLLKTKNKKIFNIITTRIFITNLKIIKIKIINKMKFKKINKSHFYKILIKMIKILMN